MIITKQVVSEKLIAYLNNQITIAQLVDWAENTFIDDELVPDEDIDLLNDILMYLAGADTAYFPLTWDVLSDFFQQLGTHIQFSIVIPSA